MCTRFCLCLPRVCSLVLYKFSWLYGGVHGDLLQEGLCHTQVCRTLRLCPCSSLLLTHTSAEDSQTQFWFSLCGVSGSCVHKVCLRPPSVSGRSWGLILNVISPLLPSCWGFSFALGHGVSFFGGIQHSPVQRLFIGELQLWSSHRRR